MIKDNGATNKYDEESSKLLPFNDFGENLIRTLNLLKLPENVVYNAKSLDHLHTKIDAIQDFIFKLTDNIELGDRYMTPSEARDYLGMSQNTFEKYRWKTEVKIKGFTLDGKNWFKKSDLDRFMMLYQVRSQQLA